MDGHIPHIDRSRREVTHSKSQSSADASNLTYPRFHGVRHFFNRMRPSADIVRKQRRRLARRTPEVVAVPHGQATVVGCFHILLSLKLTACIARATMLLVRKMGYDRTRSSSASAGSRRMRRCWIHHDNSTMLNSRRRNRTKTVLMFLYLPQGTTVHSLLNGLLMQFCRVRLAQQEDIELTPMASQSQPEAGPSCFARGARHRQAQSS